MGKKTKKTRWRTLALSGQQSDSEESSTPSSFSHQTHRNYHSKFYNSKYTYSSQSTPIRKYQNDSSKTTRSNSTTSEHKTTFNEDEYTRITTPRQDVLFKKGYLSKPKNYQTQTSTGTSSTANSTSTCTPDHQSADGTEGTDLEYESSQFVFPNGFIDQNGIYYINSYEPFPFVVYNAPICYPEYPPERTKRYSTDSAVDSASPHNEEVIQNGIAQTNGGDYYYNATASDNSSKEAPRLKKKRRRKISTRTKEDGDTTSCDTDSSDVVFEEPELSETTLALNKPHESKPNNAAEVQPAEEETDAKCPLKPDAEEFIPRTFQTSPEIPYEPNNIQYVNFAPGYISVPYINHNPTFLPPGISINYVPIQEPKFINVIVPSPAETKQPENLETVPQTAVPNKPLHEKPSPKKTPIDISKIVSKLEEAAVEQHKREMTPNKKGRYQYRPKPLDLEKPKILVGTQIPPNPKAKYSTTLKKNVERPIQNKASCPKYEKALEPSVIKPRPVNNQWISVSSRKKKRKGVNEQQDDFENVLESIEVQKPTEELFESYDVNLLEDVIPPPVNIEIANECTQTPTIPDVKQTLDAVPPVKNEQKKKNKRATQKPAKKIIIKDELPIEIESVEEPKPIITPQVTQVETVEECKPEATQQESPEKKKKKKKKAVKLQSMSSSTTTLSNLDDSYDFLLENSILEDSEQKTNIEMSEALDAMIQKGMYNSLEEKIKTLNIGASDDGFFKTINFTAFKTPPTPSKHYFTPKFDQIFPKNLTKSEPEPQQAIFLENPTVNEIIKNISEPQSKVETNLYPITQAVKNWLTKTRENTPDVELLKSPTVILNELEKHDDEVTLWSVSPQNSKDEDSWENDLPALNPPSQTNGYHVEEAQDAIEIYESKYGKNEDYLQIKAEIEDQQKTRTFPRHGNLPYRAICCNIM